MTSAAAYSAIEAEFGSNATLAALGALSEDQKSRLHEYWIDRARGELTTALAFEFMLDDLTQEGVPPKLLELARSAIADEHRHVDYCLRWARLVDRSRPAEPRLSGTRPFAFDGASDHDNRLLRTVFGGCFTETVAVHVLRESHAHITDECARRLNQQHLREEVGHARLGWALVGWPGLPERDRSMIAAYVPEMTSLARSLWLTTPRPADGALHALGYLSSTIVATACDDAIEQVTLPGLRACSIV